MRILFITATRIGDAVLSTGLLQHLIEAHPDARVTVACGHLATSLFETVPGLERILPIEKKPHGLHWLKLWAAAVPRRWDIVVDLRASAIGYLLWAGRRGVVGPRDPDLHRVVELARLLGLATPPAPRVWLSPANVEAAARLIPAGGPVLAIGPAANWVGKQWRAERFAVLAKRLTGVGAILSGARVAVLAAGHERAQARPILDALAKGRAIDLVGRVDLPTAAACLARCRLFVGNDSGLMHLAAASGIATLGLFGPSSERRYGPWGPRGAFVRTPESHAELMSPNFQAGGRGGGEVTRMDGLSVETVAAAAADLWRREASE